MPIPLDELNKKNEGLYKSSDYQSEPSAGWSDEIGSAVESTKSGLYGIGEAMGSDWAGRKRVESQSVADRQKQYADEQLDMPQTWDEAKGLGGIAKYAGGLAVSTAPQMAVTTAAGLLGGVPGAAAAGYGFALSDTLQNQREAGGTTDLLSAGAASVPYAAADVLSGGEARILRSAGVKGLQREAATAGRFNMLGRAEEAAEKVKGLKGVAARTGLDIGKTAAEEAAGETFQETMNTAARMGVDPNQEMFSDEAMGRYKESAIGGALLGGMTAGAVHPFSRSAGQDKLGDKQTSDAPVVPDKEQLGIGGPPRDDATNILDPTNRNKVNQSILDYGRSQGGSGTGGPGGGVIAPAQVQDEGNWSPTAPPNILDRQSPGEQVNRQMVENARGLPTGSPVTAQVPGAVSEAFPIPNAQSPEQQAAQQQQADTVAATKEYAEKVQRLVARAGEHGVGEKEALLFGSLEGALKNGLIDKPSFIVGVGNLASGNKQLIADTKKGIAALEAQHEINQKAAAAPAGGLQPGKAAQPATAPAAQAPAGAQAPAAPPAEQAAQREVAAVKERLSPGKTITAGVMERNGGKPISPLLRRRLYQRMGLDDAGWPRAEKRTLAEIAQIEADEKGEGKLDDAALKKKAKAIQTMLAGHGFPDAKINDAIDAMADQDHGLDTRTVDPGAEERAAGAERATPATSEGLDVEDQTDFEQGMSGTAEERPEGEASEESELEAGEGIGVKSSATSSADREKFVAHEFKDTSALLAQSPDLTAGQQKLFAAVAQMHYSKVKDAIATLIADEDVFSPAEREMLGFVFQQGKTDAAENRRDEAVAEAREMAGDKTAEEALAARNIEIIAKNAREDAAKAQRAASLARQVEEADTGEALLDALPTEMHGDIAEAATEWEQYALEGAPPWHGLATDLQAQWVKGFSHSLDMAPRASQEQRVASSEAVSRRAIGRQESAAAAADRAAADTEAAIAAAQRREELRGLAEKQDTEEKAKAQRKAERERKVGTTVVRTKRGKLNAQNTEATVGAGGTVADAGQRAGGTQQKAPERSEGGDGAPNERPAPARTGSVDQEGSQAQEPAERPAASDVGDVHGDWTTVVNTAPLMAEPPAARKPSVRIALRRANREVATGRITEAEALARVTEVAEQAGEIEGEKRSRAELVRDADHTRAQLLEGRRKGELDPDLVEMADWFIRRNPQLVQGLAISTRSPAQDRRGNELPGPAGTYESMRRIMTLIKGRASPLTAVHEILHHTERMMPQPMRAAVTRAWVKALFKAKEKAYAGDNEDLKKFFDALMYYHFDEASKYGSQHPGVALRDAMDLIRSGKVSANLFYQYVNASEFWAVNGSRIVQGRFMGSEGWQHRIKTWMREFAQKLKHMVGLQSDAPVIRALDSIAKGDGRFITGTMLAEGSGAGGVHNMYAGEAAKDQEAQAQRVVAEQMVAAGRNPYDIRLSTGWFQNPYDKKWRYEISDHKARLARKLGSFKTGENYKLSDVLKHEELYARYPDLKDVNVQFFSGGEYAHYEGYFNPTSNTIGLNRASRENPEDTLVHEIQHWVQYKEGFAVGSSSGSITNELSDEQAVHVGQKIAREQRRVLQKGREAESHMKAFITHPDYPALLDAEKRGDARTSERLQERIASDTMGVSDYGVFIGTPSYGMIRDAVQAPSVQDAHATLNVYKEINDRHEANIAAAAAGDREQIARLGYDSPALRNAYTRSAGEQEAEETARRRDMDPDFRTYFAPFPMTETGLAPEDAVVTFEPTGVSAREVTPPPATAEPMNQSAIDKHVAKLPKHLQPGAKFGLRSVMNGAKRGVTWITTTEDIMRIVEKAMPAARRYSDTMRAIVFDRQNAQLAAEKILADVKGLAPGQRERASSFMRDSTLAKKWGYKPAYVANAEVDPAMKAKFDALLPETRKAVQAAFEHMHDNLVGMRAAVVAAADAAHGTDEAAKASAIAKFDRLMAMSSDWPYMPLSRFGDFTAVGRSEAFRDVEERLREDPKNKALREQHDAMETDPAHYDVQFGQTEAHAQAIADDMRGRFDHVEHFERDKTQVMGAGSDMFAAVARLRNLAADSGFSETSARTLQKLVNDLHLSLLSERSARQSERSRKGIAGFNDDMWRNFGSRAKSNAHFLASTRSMGDVMNHLAALKSESREPGTVEGMDRAERSKHYNEIMRRHMAEMEWRPNSWVDNAMATTSFWKLLSSPSYLMMNLTQPWVMSAPVIAGRHGIGATFREMGRAYAELVPLVKSGELVPGKFKNMPRDVQAGIDALIKQGLISVSLEGELGKYGEGADAFLVTKGLKMTGDFLSNLSTKTEDMNRLATAIAALRLERSRGSSQDVAVRYAAKVLYDTHGDYSGFNSPPWMRSKFGRLASQFRKFQIIQVGLWFKLANDAFVGKGLTKDERWAAMKSFGYSLGTMMTLGGALALPGAQVIALMLGAAFGDPDEPNNPELAMRKWIGNDDLADLILKGVPAYLGADLSSRLGVGDLFSVLPYSDPEVSKAGVERMAIKVLGPAIGMLADTADGVGMMMNGDWWKGLEKIAPRGLSDVSKGARLASQGFTNKSGEVTVQADDVGTLSGVLQAVGIPTSTLTDRSFRASAKFVQDKYYTARTLDVKKDYTEAYAAGDTEGMRDARDRWTNMQAARRSLGYKPSPLSDLLKAPADRAKHEKQTIGGVQYRGQRDRGAAQVLSEL